MQLKKEACLIDGAWVENGRWLDVEDPATGESVGRVPRMGAPETEAAIKAAQRAFPGWSSRSAGDRADVLRRLYSLILSHQDELATLLSSEQGKPKSEARGEIAYAASYVQWFAEEALRAYGDVIPGHQADKRILVMRQPVGVVAAITPWNFPAAMIARKLAPALAAGCTIVIKPAEQTPFTALALGALCERAGVPAGVVNIVTGDPAEIGGAITANPAVRKLSFTGSTATGARLMAQCAPTIKKLSLELGGNAPFIVFADADIDAAVEGALVSKYRNAGQTCVCANRFYVQAEVYHSFIDRFVAASRKLKVAPASQVDATIGPLIDKRALAKVEAHIADAVAKGATLALGGRPHALGGNFFEPTILAGATNAMMAVREETFGPVAPIVSFESEAEAVRLANDSESGLAAYLYTRDLARAWRVSEALETGMVGLNTGLISTAVAPFGGIKMSGLGREGSRYGLDDYLELKYVCIDVN